MDLIFHTILYEQSALLAPDDFLLANLLHPSTLLSPRLTFSLISHFPNLHCTEDCEMIHFPILNVAVLTLKQGHKCGTFWHIQACEMCKGIDFDVVFSESVAIGESSKCSSVSGKGSMDTTFHI